MHRQSITMNTPDMPIRASQCATALPQRRLAGDDVQHTCSIAQTVVAIAFGHLALPPSGPGTAVMPKPIRATAFVRQTAMYLAHVGFGLSMAEIGRAFGRDRTTVVHACHLVEDRRDETRFDDLLDHLEQAATALRAAAQLDLNG